MGPRVGELTSRVAGSRRGQCFGERVLLAPAAQVMQLNLKSAQSGHFVLPVREEALHQSLPGPGNRLAKTGELRIPDVHRTLLLERRVALLQCAGVSHPGLHEAGFHVEHGPVEPAAPSITPLFNQPVHARLDHLDRESLRQLRQGFRRATVNSGGRAGACGLEAEGLRPANGACDLTNDSQLILSVGYDALIVSRAERSTPSEHEYRLEQRGLPRPIVAPDKRQPGGAL